VVLTHAQGPIVAETDVQELLARESIQPQTVTILADYASIGYRNIELERPPPPAPAPVISAGSGEVSAGTTGVSGGTSVVAPPPAPPEPYIVRTEPFVTTQSDQPATFGVGRIPLESLGDASVFYVRGLLRERLFAHRSPRLLMVSNSGTGRRALPLCETISRNTAAEFKNFGVDVDEFYGQATDSPGVLTAARTANLILYEGHTNMELIDPPILRRPPSQDYPLDEEDLEGVAGPAVGIERDTLQPSARVVVAESTTQHLQGPLEGLPIVVLQSCESLDDAVLWRLDELGGAALIGSVTAIHSGCGSDMLNSAMTSLLYRGGTLGEVLRDAQNYMFCVEELKARRGHKEMAKGVRVALSFRLWGDPEMRVLPAALGAPRQAPVRAAWIGGDTMRIYMPDSRLPESRSEKYVADMFPNSQAAGLMRTVEGETVKKVLPFYYFCLPLPESLAKGGATQLEATRADARRVDARIDRSRGLVYVVYYPEQETPGESIDVRLKPVTEQSRRLAK
jgi:hypothetical protein